MKFNRSDFINNALQGTRSVDLPVSDPSPSVDIGGVMKSLTDTNTLINPKSKYYTVKVGENKLHGNFSENANLEKKLTAKFYKNNFGDAYVNYMKSLSREPFNSEKMAYSRKLFGHNVDKVVGTRILDNYNEEVLFDQRIFYKNDAERAQNKKNSQEKDIFHDLIDFARKYEIWIVIILFFAVFYSKSYLLDSGENV